VQRTSTVSLDWHRFQLASGSDHLYNVAGVPTVLAPGGGTDELRVGDEVDLTVAIPIAATLSATGGIGRFFPGPFVEENSAGSAATFGYVALAFRF